MFVSPTAMSLCQLLRRSAELRRRCSTTTTSGTSPVSLYHRFHSFSLTQNDQATNPNPNPDPDPNLGNGLFQNLPPNPNPTTPSFTIPPPLPHRTMAFSSAEEAAAERRRRKRRLRIEPPLHALRRDSSSPPPRRDPNAPRLPDTTSALVGSRLNLHNRVQSLIRASDLDAASRLARQSVFSNTRPTVFTCNAIIAAMYRAKRYSDAIALFQYFFKQSDIVPNIVSYNQIINAHCDEGRVDEALELYRHILANAPFGPSPVTYRHLTKGLIDAERIDEAVDLLREMLNKGQAADSLVYNNLIRGFLDKGNLEKANEFFDELKSKCLVYDGVVNATFMEFWFKQGEDKLAMESYKSLLDKKFRLHPPTCNVLLEVLLKYGKKSEAWALFDEMLDNHSPPNIQAVNSETFNIMVNECFKLEQFKEAIDAFRKVGTKPGSGVRLGSKPFAMDVAGFSNMISRCCEHGMLSEAEMFLAELCAKSLSPDVPIYRAMVDAYLKADRINDAVQMLNRMVDSNLRVVANFGTRVLGEFIRNGKHVESAQILTKMSEKEPKPDPSIYDAVIRGLCEGDALDAAMGIVRQMVGYGIGVPPALREFVIEAFEKAGMREEIEKALNSSSWNGGNPRQPRTSPPHLTRRPVPSGPVQTGAQQTTGSYNRAAPWMANQTSYQQQQSWSNQTATQQQPSWSNQTTTQQPSGTSQTNGENPYGHHTSGTQSWSNTPVSHQTTVQPSWAGQAAGHQSMGSSSPTEHQQSWSNPTGTQHSAWSSSTTENQKSWENQTGGQQTTWSHRTGSSWSSGTQQTWRQDASSSSHMFGQQGQSQPGQPQTSSVNGHQGQEP